MLLLAGCGGGERASETDDAAGAERGLPIAAVEVQPRDLSRQVAVTGTVEPRMHIRLASRTSGTVDDVFFEAADNVQAGDLLARLDMSEHRAELERTRALQQEARLEYRRYADLQEGRMVSATEYQRARAALEVLNSEVKLWETRIAFGNVTAPRDGVLTARHIEPGEAVEAHELLFELAALDALVIRPGISERDVVHLEVGQTIPVRLDALPGLELEGTLRRIFPSADAGSRLVPIEVALPADAMDRGVRPGFLARIRITVDERGGALAVPAAALGEDGQNRYVYLVRDERLARRTVEPGVTRGEWTEIRAGLEPGDIVLATNPIDMRDGQRVRIVGWRG
jgi:membrane fusion protein, multidrug efflux system